MKQHEATGAMTNTFAVLAAVFVLLGGAPAWAADWEKDANADAATVGRLLKSCDGVIPEPAELSRVSDDPAAALMAVVNDARVRDRERGWALLALTHFDQDERVYAFFTAKLEHPDPATDFQTVLVTFVQAYGERAIAVVEPLVSDHDLSTQRAAIVALGLFGGQAGYRILQQLAQDPPAGVADVLRDYVY